MATKKNPNYGNTQALMVVIVLLAGIAFLALMGGPSQGSVSTTTNTTVNSTTTVVLSSNMTIYTPAQELPNMSIYDPNLTMGSFACTVSTQCVLVRTSTCFNNAPSQQACISSSYSSQYNASFGNYLSSQGGTVCPDYFLAGNASCACIDNGCSMIYQRG